MRNQVTTGTTATSRKMSTKQIAKVLAYQGQAEAIRKALAAEAASWPEGTWSADQETRLAEKMAASNELWGVQSREAYDMGARYRVEQRLLDQLGFVEAILRRLVK